MKLDITKLPVGEILIGFVLVMVIVTFVGAFIAVGGGGEGGEAVLGSPTVSPPPGGSPTPGGSPAGNVFQIAMVATIKFDQAEVVVPANTEVTVRADNRDDAIPHNWAAYTDASAKRKIAATGICSAPCLKDVKFTAPAPGEYFFRCDVHPQQMTGKLIVK